MTQNEAVHRFKTAYERAQIGGARAVDPGNEPVDGGWSNPEAVFERGVDDRRLLLGLQDRLDGLRWAPLAYRKLEFVVIQERGPTPFAKHFYRLAKPNNQAVSKAMAEVRAIVDVVAKHMGLISR